MAATHYQLTVTNLSHIDTSFVMYLGAPKKPKNVYTLAWQCRYCPCGSTVRFNWSEKFSAIWCQPSQRLSIGVHCNVSPATQVDNLLAPYIYEPFTNISSISGMAPFSDGMNRANLSYIKDYATYKFSTTSSQPPENLFFTDSDITTPSANTCSTVIAAGIGIGVSNRGAFLVDVQPNTVTEWSMEPEYYLTWGNFSPGEIIDISMIGEKSLNIKFNDFLQSKSALLDSSNTLIHL